MLGRAEEGVLGGRERHRPALDVHDRHIGGEGRGRERLVDSIRERWRHLSPADPVPLQLLVERPAVLAQGPLPGIAKLGPVRIADGDSAEREEAAAVEATALVEAKEAHG